MSPYPASFDGSGTLFWMALFALLVLTSLCTMMLSLMVRHLYEDRGVDDPILRAYRTGIVAACTSLIMFGAPEIAHLISFAEAPPDLYQTILNTKRVFNVLLIFPVLFWLALLWAWNPDITFKLRSPTAVVWADHRYASLKRFSLVVFLSGALALCVTVGLAFH